MLLVGCGRIGFASLSDSSNHGGDSGDDADTTPPTAHTTAYSIVDTAGITATGSEADGTHLVFVDNTPGMNGNLVIFREGDNAATIKAYVSTDGGITWTRYILMPTNTVGINAMGACQDTVDHAFHLIWLDTTNADQYGRWKPSYTGGDITGFSFATAFAFFDDGGDSPGPRDIAEIVDASGNHRLVFAGTGPSGGSTGLYKLAVTTVAIGLAPMAQNDWAKASDVTKTGSDDQLLPNNYATGDGPNSYMVTVSSNLVGGVTAPIVVVAGLPIDKKLLAWTITPTAGTNDFAISATQTLSTFFGSGTGTRADASLSLASAPSGVAIVAYNEDSAAPSPGLHVATVDTAGTVVVDAYPQPSTSTQARHAVIATDSVSRPAVLYADGAGNILGTLFWNPAWLPATQVSTLSTPAGAWNISNVWRPGGQDSFGVYRDAGASTTTTFSQVYWR
jgi:hypothetical protein